MSFFANNERPDLLKKNEDSRDSRFGEVPSALPDVQPSPFTTTEARSGFGSASPVNPTAAPTPPDRCTNVIAQGARFKGSLKVDESVRIDGVFSGDIDAKGTIHVSEGAEVDAKVHGTFIVVSGTFRGEIRAEEKTELMPKSKVSGEVFTKALSVHEGAIIDGTLQMTSDASRTGARGRNGNGAAATAAATQETEERRRTEAAPN